jgi:hypothetical protein
VSLAAVALCAGPLSAQGNLPMSPAAAVPEWRSFIGANPLGIPFDIVSVEGETTVATGSTIGVVASYNDIDSKQYTTGDLRYKYYPSEVAMRGFGVGLSVGMSKFRGADGTFVCGTPPCGDPPIKTIQSPTLGVLIDYNWTQGPSQKFVIGTGVGAKRVLASETKRNEIGLDRAYVTARFVIGLLF